MAQAIWQGSLAQRSRTASGLILFAFAFFHFLNVAAGLVSPEMMRQVQNARLLITGHNAGKAILYSALLLHMALAIWQVASRRTLRMTASQALQLALGLLIPLQLIQHVVFVRYAGLQYGFDDGVSSVILSLWFEKEALPQFLLLLAVWAHGCIGLHMWLRITSWWTPVLPFLTAIATLVPALALAGLITEGRRMWNLYSVPGNADPLIQKYNWPGPTAKAALTDLYHTSLYAFVTLVLVSVSVYYVRRLIRSRNSLQIAYADGPKVSVEHGPTLLEISQINGISHPSLCGGKGRCTTCRVAITKGLGGLPAPSAAEARSLQAINAPANVRLACQINPTTSMTVKRVVQPQGRRRVHDAQGEEKTIAILFLDIRGFTARSAGLPPYDVVFLLNLFFDAIVPEITRSGGVVDKFIGDGLLAMFESDNPADSALAGLLAASRIGVALARFNRVLASEGKPPVFIGMGLHMGPVVLGEIGAAGHAPRTLIGATVNATARLESKTKELGVELLVSEMVFETADISSGPQELQPFDLRGVDRPIRALPIQRASALAALLDASPPD